MNRIPAWLTYSVLRLLLLFVPFGILLALGMQWLTALIISSVLAFALSLMLLRAPRDATSIAIHAARQRSAERTPSSADIVEDAHAEHVRADAEQQQRNRAAAAEAERDSADDAARGNIEGA